MTGLETTWRCSECGRGYPTIQPVTPPRQRPHPIVLSAARVGIALLLVCWAALFVPYSLISRSWAYDNAWTVREHAWAYMVVIGFLTMFAGAAIIGTTARGIGWLALVLGLLSLGQCVCLPTIGH